MGAGASGAAPKEARGALGGLTGSRNETFLRVFPILSLYRRYQEAVSSDVAPLVGGFIVGSAYAGRIYGTHHLDCATTGDRP